MQFRYTVNYLLPFMVLKLTSSPQNVLFESQGTPLIWGNFMRSGQAILGKPNQRTLSGAHHRICLPDVWIVLINVFMNLVYHHGLCERKAARQLPLNWTQKKIKRQTGTGVHLLWSCRFPAQRTGFCSRLSQNSLLKTAGNSSANQSKTNTKVVEKLKTAQG